MVGQQTFHWHLVNLILRMMYGTSNRKKGFRVHFPSSRIYNATHVWATDMGSLFRKTLVNWSRDNAPNAGNARLTAY